MFSDYLVRIAVAALVGAAIGAEREFRDKAAGLRTIMLICIGSCLFTILGQELITPERGDPVRITSAIVSGVGFLGAGVIFRRGKQSTGITTAATIWCSAALGMACGGGKFDIAIATTVGILTVLWILPPLERLIDFQREAKTYEMTTALGEMSIEEIHKLFDDSDLKVVDCSHGKRDDIQRVSRDRQTRPSHQHESYAHRCPVDQQPVHLSKRARSSQSRYGRGCHGRERLVGSSTH